MSSIIKALDLDRKEMIITVGGGGKTSIINRLARESVKEGKRVLITTTTKIYPPAGYPLIIEKENTGMIEEIKTLLSRHGIAVAGKEITSEQKITGLSTAIINKLFNIGEIDLLLVEGDGARGRPFKAPREHEPVIPGDSTMVMPVVGAECIGKPLIEEYFFCIEQVYMLAGLNYGDIVTVDEIAKMLLHKNGYKKYIPENARWIPFINKIELAGDLRDVHNLAGLLLEAGTEKVLAGSALQEEVPVKKIFSL